MKNYLKFISIVYLLFHFVILQSCRKDYDLCEGEPDTEIIYNTKVSEEFRTLFPYKGNETLTFISNSGDTAILFGKGQIFKYSKSKFYGSNDCTKFFTNHEIYFTEFTGSNLKLNKIKLEMLDKGEQSVILKPYINIFEDLGDYWNESAVGLKLTYLPELSNTKFFYKDSLVSAFKLALYRNKLNNQIPYVYLYKEKGIIGFSIDSSTVYTLQ